MYERVSCTWKFVSNEAANDNIVGNDDVEGEEENEEEDDDDDDDGCLCTSSYISIALASPRRSLLAVRWYCCRREKGKLIKGN